MESGAMLTTLLSGTDDSSRINSSIRIFLTGGHAPFTKLARKREEVYPESENVPRVPAPNSLSFD